MHKLTITLTVPNDIHEADALANFAEQLHDVAEDIASLTPRSTAFGSYGDNGCKVYYRVEIDDAPARADAAAR